ncbi:MAG: LysR family transcriptional regulator [Fulvimarina manganoxydans]|uniref:LysR family transcriptional regulator n=1 Tax=Fulvimarina manganoxydans TaxID=937218 RepID=UPI002354A168|nr:LysR family transcriptional regulator [Fulvimarina manganoxydans]MCK5932697.1 LysR family transcriptional regulator [Fulvimarina manganoxydans]
MSDLSDIRLLVEVIESGGFNRAAARLGISKSIVSRRIAALEASLGAQLLSRTTRGVSPTEAGLEFKRRGERILADVAEAREAVAEQGGAMIGRLRLSVPLVFGLRHITPLLADLAERHPRLEIDVSFSDRLVDLIGEHFDAAIRIGELSDSSLVARRIAPVRAALVASPAYLDRRGRPREPADLLQHDCLLYTSVNALDWKFRSGKRWVSVRPSGRLRADNGEATVQFAVAGLGIANAPDFIVSQDLRSGALEVVLPEYPTPEFGIYVLRPPGPHVPAKVRALIDTMIARFGDAPDWCQ